MCYRSSYGLLELRIEIIVLERRISLIARPHTRHPPDLSLCLQNPIPSLTEKRKLVGDRIYLYVHICK